MPQYQLVVRRGPRAGETFELKSQTVIIGRDSTADIIINDPEVSRNHCRLILDRSYYLQDLGSTNGTFIDGQRLGGEPVRLANGQIIQLGSNVTLLHQEVEANAEIVSTQMGMGPADTPIGSAAPPAAASPSEPPPVFGQPATPPSSFNEPPAYNPPAAPEPSFGQAPPPPQRPVAPEPLKPGGPVEQARQAYQQQAAGGQGPRQPQGGGEPVQSSASGEKKGFLGRMTGGGDSASSGGNGDMPWSNWTQRQWMIAASALVILLLCICCLFVLAVVVAVNPEALNLQSSFSMHLPLLF